MSKQANNPLRGIVLSRYRSISEAAKGIGMTRFRLADIVSGATSPTVDEVLDITKSCDADIDDVLAAVRHMREQNSASQCDDGSCKTSYDAQKKE